MEPFNNGLPLRVVTLDDGTMGIVDEAHMRVWLGTEYASTRVTGTMTEVVLPTIPSSYGSFLYKPIGGVSKTVRRVGCITSQTRHSGAVVVFATQAPTQSCVCDAMETGCTVPYTLGDSEVDAEFGNVTEIVVHDGTDVDHVCALVARTGAIPVLEHSHLNAARAIGIERLDRIEAAVLQEDGSAPVDYQYGARRGEENWRFAWLPEGWRPPITWDHMVENMAHVDVGRLPQPLRQHVARERIRRGEHEPIGTRWRIAEMAPTQEELAYAGDGPPGPPLRAVLRSETLTEVMDDRPECFTRDQLDAYGLTNLDSIRVLVQGRSGTWYRPRDTRHALTMHIPGRRLVSAALENVQSEQLITAFYLLSVERVRDPTVRTAASLVLFRYMFERGYTARWMGKYVQDANFIGNGNRFRYFKRLSQYDPDRLPLPVLNKICGSDGRMTNRGS